MEPSQKVADDKEQSPSYPQPPPNLPILTGKVLYMYLHMHSHFVLLWEKRFHQIML
jgi:hypothetical protein